jgi:pimeloyl-ACP methyl ester carboxylesterase
MTKSGAMATAHRTFVLVHGACHGGWCWRRVANRLEARGHRVFTPTLTGLGERSHLLNRDIDLDTHIADIVNVFRWEDLTDACLVVHSYGGWPGSGALEQIGDRVSSIVWLDAQLPHDGQCGMDTANPRNRADMQAAIEQGAPARPAPKAEFFGVNERDRAWVDAKTTAQPIGVSLQPIRLTGARERVAKKLYIRAPSFEQAAFDKAYAECKADPSWQTLVTDAGHDVMIDAPEWLADILLKVSVTPLPE